MSIGHPLVRKKTAGIDWVLADKLILREKGSGEIMVFCEPGTDWTKIASIWR